MSNALVDFVSVIRNLTNNDIVSWTSHPSVKKSTLYLSIIAKAIKDKGGRQIICVKPNEVEMMFDFSSIKSSQEYGAVGFFTTEKETFSNPYFDGRHTYTPIVYTTADALAIKMLKLLKKISSNNNDLYFCDLIVIDGSFTRSANIDLLLYLWRSLYEAKLMVPKLVLLDTVIEQNSLLDGLNMKIITTPNEFLPEILYHDKNYTSRDHQEKIEDMIGIILIEHVNNPINEDECFLVFVPSDDDVHMVHSKLKSKDIDLLPLYSKYDNTNTIRNLRYKSRGERRKIIVTSTNLSSIGINVSIVFDSLTQSIDTNGQESIVFVSKVEADRRMLLANMENSRCKRFISEGNYSVTIPSNTLPYILRENIESASINLLSNNIDPYRFLRMSGMSNHAIGVVKSKMEEYNLIDEEGIITNVGRFVSNSNIPLHHSLALNKWKDNYGTRDIMTLIAFTALTDMNLYKFDENGNLSDRAIKFNERIKYKNEIILLELNALSYITNKIGTFDFTESRKTDATRLANNIGLDPLATFHVSRTIMTWKKYVEELMNVEINDMTIRFNFHEHKKMLMSIIDETYSNSAFLTGNVEENIHLYTNKEGRNYMFQLVPGSEKVPKKISIFTHKIQIHKFKTVNVATRVLIMDRDNVTMKISKEVKKTDTKNKKDLVEDDFDDIDLDI